MKTIYFQCNMGAAGDMLMASLLELLDKPEIFIDKLNALNIPKIYISYNKAEKCGIVGTNMVVKVDGVEEDNIIYKGNHKHSDTEHKQFHSSHINLPDKHNHENKAHSHSKLKDICQLIDNLEIPAKVKEDAQNIYKIIADAESKVHNRELGDIHFHEVGTMDAVADIVGVCLLINEISPDKIIASPINVGSGQVRCAHGILPVPAPATTLILKGVPIYSGNIEGELCTPTGAALLKYFTDEFMDMPQIRIEKIGYGMGKKDFNAVNCVRCILGEVDGDAESIVELCCNLDDMTGEAIGYAVEVLFNNGALDVYTTSIGMKKNRPGTMLSCMCRIEDRQKFVSLIFKHTTTIGIRQYECGRYTLSRTMISRETELGIVEFKRVEGYEIIREKAEYESVKEIADKNNLSFADVIHKVYPKGTP